MKLANERECHFRMVFEENDGGWMVRNQFYKVSGSGGKKFLWEVIYDHVVEEETDHNEIGLRWFDFNFFDKDAEGVVIEGLMENSYLLMLMNLQPGDWNNQLESMNMKMDEENGKYTGMVNGRA